MSRIDSKPADSSNDKIWDAFVASLHRVWEFAPDFLPTSQLHLAERKVLLIDADLEHAFLLTEQLRKVGVFATHFDQTSRIEERIEGQFYDLLIYDALRSDEHRFALCERLADSAAIAGVPIIVLGDDEFVEAVWAWRKAGARFYLRKPYDPYVLLTLMSAALDRDA